VDDQLLIGREREQAQLRAWAADALAGRGSLVLLAGEAGVGKTTLARRALAGSVLEVLEGVGVQGGTSAFGPVVEVLRAHLRIEGGGPLVEGPWPPAAGSRPARPGWSCWRARTSRSPTASATPCCCGRPACPTTPGSPS
jgi:hypothetical protein